MFVAAANEKVMLRKKTTVSAGEPALGAGGSLYVDKDGRCDPARYMATVTGALALAKNFSVPVTTAATPTNPGHTVLELAIPVKVLLDSAPLSVDYPVCGIENWREAGFERISCVQFIKVLAETGPHWEPPTFDTSPLCTPSIQGFIAVLMQLTDDVIASQGCELRDQPNHIVAKVREDDDGNHNCDVVIFTLATHETPTIEQLDESLSPTTGETDAGGTNRVPDELELAIQALLRPYSSADEEKSMSKLFDQLRTSNQCVRTFRWAMQAVETFALDVSERKDLGPKGGMEGLGVQLTKCLTIYSCIKLKLEQLVQKADDDIKVIKAAGPMLLSAEKPMSGEQRAALERLPVSISEALYQLKQGNVELPLRERHRASLEADIAQLDESLDWPSASMISQYNTDSTGTSVPPGTFKPTADSHSAPQPKQMPGERLFPVVQKSHPALAPRITGMLLEMDDSELLRLLEEDREALALKVEEAVKVLEDHATDAILAYVRKTGEECDRKLGAWTAKREQIAAALLKAFQPVGGMGRSMVAAAARNVLAREMEAIRSADELASRKRADAAMQALVEEETQSIVQEKAKTERHRARRAKKQVVGAQQQQMLGERLLPVVQKSHPALAPKITEMLLEMDNAELLRLLEEDSEALARKVEEAVKVLDEHATA